MTLKPDMTWETPVVEDIACGMEVTSYAGADEGDDLNTSPTAVPHVIAD